MSAPKILALEGEIDFHLSPEVAASLRSIVANKPLRVIVDLANVTYVDSSGLAALVQGMEDTRAYGGEFSLVGIREDVRPIFQNACLDQVFAIFPDVGSALAATTAGSKVTGSDLRHELLSDGMRDELFRSGRRRPARYWASNARNAASMVCPIPTMPSSTVGPRSAIQSWPRYNKCGRRAADGLPGCATQ